MNKTLSALRDLCADGRIKWTLHSFNRIRERKISSVAVIETISYGEPISHYEDDIPFPSWLIFNGDFDAPLHVVASTDGEKCYIITAYVPTPDDWQSDYVTRKD